MKANVFSNVAFKSAFYVEQPAKANNPPEPQSALEEYFANIKSFNNENTTKLYNLISDNGENEDVLLIRKGLTR